MCVYVGKNDEGNVLMKRLFHKKDKKAVALVIFSLVLAVLTTAAVYCIHKFLLDDHDAYDDEEDEDYIDENGVCYTDEKNFVD